MTEILDETLREWTQGRNALEARINIFNKIRDIPYAIIPEINDYDRFTDILTIGKGSCSPKHLLLCELYQRLGMSVLFAVYPFRWDEVEIDYPPKLMKLAQALPTSYHLACMVDINGELVLVDATLDPALKEMGLPVNEEWDGISNTQLAIIPCGEVQIHHPSEALFMTAQRDEKSLAFYGELNRWLDAFRGL